MPFKLTAMQYVPMEWGFTSGKAYNDPCNEVTLDVQVTAPDGSVSLVPCYWSGGQEWRVRYAAAQIGVHAWRTICSDATNPDLHGVEGSLDAQPYHGNNPLYARGPLQVAPAKNYMQFADGTPFFWLADTWWMSLTRRITWPDEFQILTADRVEKGYSVVLMVAGLYPDMPAYDERGFNEAGHPWEPDYARLNPGYFDMADLRIQHLVRAGLVPCVVGCWAYHLPWLGMDKMKLHWRNLIARWGAYPVVWCLAGEVAMPYYLAEDKAAARAYQVHGWTEIGRYVRETDPFHRLVSIHPTDLSRTNIEDASVLDIDMVHPGHAGWEAVPNLWKRANAAFSAEPKMPVINSEMNYEGILEGSREEVQRFDFWASVLLGAGFTYGANGIWQLNRAERPYGPSPHGASWGDTPWTEAYRLPGGKQIGLGKKFLERYPWWKFEAHPEWIDGAASDEKPIAPYAAGIPGQLRLVYFPKPIFPWGANPQRLRGLEQGAVYRTFWFNPRNADEINLPDTTGDADGSAPLPVPTVMQDWLLVMERVRS